MRKKSLKRIFSLALVLALVLSIAPVSGAYKMPAGESLSYKLTEKYIDSHGLKGDVNVRVNLSGVLGTLDMAEVGIENEIRKACGWSWWYGDTEPDTQRPIYVLKSGSKVNFSISSTDPQACYNFCYDKREFDQYTFDDCGGGCVYRFDEGEMDSSPLFVLPNGDGSAMLTGGTYATASAKKTGSNSYSYSAEEGLFTFCFTAKEKAGEGEFDDNTGGVGKYIIGTFLFVSEEQVAELEQSGTMTFHDEAEWTAYQHLYPGIAELFDIDLKPISIRFGDDFYATDFYGYHNEITFTNNTKEHIKGVFSLLLYTDRLWCGACNGVIYETEHRAKPAGQIYSIDLDLEAGESYTTGFYFNSEKNLATTKYILVEYDDAAEREQYLSSKLLSPPEQTDLPPDLHGYWTVEDKAYLEAFPYGIDFKPFTHE